MTPDGKTKMQTKYCKSCKQDKAKIDFYKSKKEKDGLQTYCKACKKLMYREWKEKQRQHYRAMRGSYYQHNKAEILDKNDIWRKQNPEKEHTICLLNSAVRRRQIEKPEQCEQCGSSNPEAHHEDYTKPYNVIWLCRSCHIATRIA